MNVNHLLLNQTIWKWDSPVGLVVLADAEGSGQSEIGKFQRSRFGDENIGSFQVSVQNLKPSLYWVVQHNGNPWLLLTLLLWMKYNPLSSCWTTFLISPKLNLTFLLASKPARSWSQNSKTKKNVGLNLFSCSAFVRQISIRLTMFSWLSSCNIRISLRAVIGN